MKKRRTRPALERLMERLDFTDDGCWMWTGHVSIYGYGQAWLTDRVHPAHRAVYLAIGGEVPDGFECHHTCPNTACCNPEHIQIIPKRPHGVISGMNNKRNRDKTCCPKGHEYSADNTYILPSGTRSCRKCARIRQVEWNMRNPEKAREHQDQMNALARHRRANKK